MLECDREIDLELSVARRARIIGDHGRAALRKDPARAERAKCQRAEQRPLQLVTGPLITDHFPSPVRKPKASLCSAPSSAGSGTLPVMESPLVRIAPTANKSGAS